LTEQIKGFRSKTLASFLTGVPWGQFFKAPRCDQKERNTIPKDGKFFPKKEKLILNEVLCSFIKTIQK
jgi:hypothetical protein